MIAQLLKAGIESTYKDFDTYEKIHGLGGLGLELSVQLDQIKTIGLMLEGIKSRGAVQELPDDFVTGVGHLIQFHVDLAVQLSEAVQESVKNGGEL